MCVALSLVESRERYNIHYHSFLFNNSYCNSKKFVVKSRELYLQKTLWITNFAHTSVPMNTKNYQYSLSFQHQNYVLRETTRIKSKNKVLLGKLLRKRDFKFQTLLVNELD